jgi:OmpA-OmpF porin, OOP family
MKHAFLIAAIAVAASFATPANAQSNSPPPASSSVPAPAPAPSPDTSTTGSLKAFVTGGVPYLGFGLGMADTSGLSGSSTGATVTGDAYKVSGKVLGGYQFTPNVGLEAQYGDLGSRTVTAGLGNVSASGNTTATQFSIAGTGTAQIYDWLSAFGKLGASRNQLSGGSFCAGIVYCSAYLGSHTDVMWGAGLNFIINKRLTLRAEYEDFGKFAASGGPNGAVAVTGGPSSGTVRTDNFALDLIWSF